MNQGESTSSGGEVTAPHPNVARPREQQSAADAPVRQSQETFYNLIQNNPFGVYIIDAEFRLAHVSRGAQKVFANVPRPLIGRDFSEVLRFIWPEPFASEAVARFRTTLETGEPYVATRTIEHRKDIQDVEAYDWRIERITLPDGRPGVVCYFYDLSERQRLEAALHDSEARRGSALAVANLGTFDWDVASGQVTLDDRSREIFGFGPGEGTQAQELFARIDPADLPRISEELAASRRDLSRLETEYRIVLPDGTGRSVISITHAAAGEDGHAERMFGVFGDITVRKRTEAALAQTQRRLDSALIAGEIGTYEWDVVHDRLWGDRNFARIFGISLDAGGAAPLADYVAAIHPDDRAMVMDRVNRTVQTGIPYEAEYRIVSADQTRWVVARGRGEQDDEGRVVRFAGVVLDITDRKRVEERLRTSEERLALSVGAADLGTFYCPMPLGRIEWNETCKAHFWLPPDAEIDFDRFYSIVHPDDRERTRRAVERAVYGREPYDIEYRTVAPDGRQRWIRAKGRAYYDAAGNPLRFDGVTLDVTDRRRAVDALRDREQRFREMADTAPAMLWLTDTDGACTFLSRGWYEFTGQTTEEGLGLGWANAAHPDDRAAAAAAFVAANRERSSYEVDFRLRRADGEYRWVIDAGRPRFGSGGEFLGFIGSVIDITERKRAEEERNRLLEAERAARSEAERAGRLKDEFLATLSHELRTPLNAILGWSQILARGTRDGEQLAEGLRVIERNARVQTQIIDDLLDMSRIISGKVRLDVQRTELEPVLRAAIDTVMPAADAKGVRIHPALDPSVGAVSADPGRLQQVFWNLLTNAVKFTPKGGRVQVLLERVSSHIEISVIDNGEGIAPEFLPHVFDRFRQADATTTRRHGGLGLGLSIVKQLVELHGGSVTVDSAGAGLGSAFRVSLPLTVLALGPDDAPEREHPRATPVALALADTCVQMAGVKVLVVDDEPDARALVKRLLEDCDAAVATAGSAAEALEMIRAARPDVLVTDIGMPVEDGYTLLRKVRALPPADGGNMPAVALTAYARAEDRVKSVLAGFQMHLTKPVDPLELIATVAALAGRIRTDGR